MSSAQWTEHLRLLRFIVGSRHLQSTLGTVTLRNRNYEQSWILVLTVLQSSLDFLPLGYISKTCWLKLWLKYLQNSHSMLLFPPLLQHWLTLISLTCLLLSCNSSFISSPLQNKYHLGGYSKCCSEISLFLPAFVFGFFFFRARLK